jgi:hypothetical protein
MHTYSKLSDVHDKIFYLKTTILLKIIKFGFTKLLELVIYKS